MRDSEKDLIDYNERGNSRALKILLIGVIIFVFLVITFLISMKTINEDGVVLTQIVDGKITRTYDEIFAELEEEPEDISQLHYYSHIPKIIRNDIDVMMNSEEDISIFYQKEDKLSNITITKNEDGDDFWVEIFTRNGALLDDYARMEGEISFYKNGNSIAIYGRDSTSNRIMKKSYLSLDEDGYDSLDRLWVRTAFDLWGTETLKNADEDDFWNYGYDQVRLYNSDMTLANVGKEFNFYIKGYAISEPIVFPGGEIVDFNYYYILDDKNDLYYFYYSTNPDNYWIHFEKVAENIDYVTDDKMSFEISGDEYKPIEFVVYVKNGKHYVAVADYFTEKYYGQNYGKSRTSSDICEPDFSITTIAVDDENVSTVILSKNDFMTYSSSTLFDWYLRYEYKVGDICVFAKKRLNGLDREVSINIPDKKIERFDGMELTVEEIQSVKDELKAIYAEYE